MGDNEKKIAENDVNAYSESVGCAADYLAINTLRVEDTRTTISANANGKHAYMEGQLVLQSLGEALDRESDNISSLGYDFKEYDQMLTNLWNSGTRFNDYQEESR